MKRERPQTTIVPLYKSQRSDKREQEQPAMIHWDMQREMSFLGRAPRTKRRHWSAAVVVVGTFVCLFAAPERTAFAFVVAPKRTNLPAQTIAAVASIAREQLPPATVDPVTFRLQQSIATHQPQQQLDNEESSTTSQSNNLQVSRKRRVSPDTVAVVGSLQRQPQQSIQAKYPKSATTAPPSTSSSSTPSAKSPYSRSSTMPRFGVDRRAYDKRVRMLAHKTGRPTISTVSKPQYNDMLYKSTPAVPDSMVLFVKEIHQEERITRQEEMDLGVKTQEGLRMQSVFDLFQQQHGRAPTDDEWCAASGKINMEAINQAMDEGMQAKNRLVTSNLRMVQSVVNTYIRNGLGTSYNAGDLMQEGIMALIRAAEKFEPHRGFKFSTYAMYWVRSSVKRSHIVQTRPMIPIPQRLFERNKQLLRVQEQLLQETGIEPTAKELGRAVGISEKQVQTCFRAMGVHCSSIDQALFNPRKPNNAASATGFGDLIPDAESNPAERELLREDLLLSLQKHLDPEQLELLLLRFGVTIDGCAPSLFGPTNGKMITVAELSRRLGMKPWKIRKSIDESIEKLQESGIDEWRVFAEDLA